MSLYNIDMQTGHYVPVEARNILYEKKTSVYGIRMPKSQK